MSKDSQQERERLKEEFKEHYRKMREAKERLNRARKTKRITEALRDMDTSQLMESFDEFLINVKTKIASVEARLDVAMESLAGEDEDEVLENQKRDEELKKAKAKETLRQAKIEMGLLYNHIEEQADAMKVEKTIGTKSDKPENREEGGS